MKNEYKTYNSRNHDLLENEKLLPLYNHSLVQTMIHEVQVLENQIHRFMIDTEPKSFTIKNMKGEAAYWEISFTQPVIQYVPTCFRFLTRNIMYYYQKGRFAEYVPCYIPNINHVTLLVNYNSQNPEFENNVEGILKQHVLEGGKKMTLSSLNLLLRGSYRMMTLNEKAHHYVKSSFEFCYWNLPTTREQPEASCINNMIYSRSSKIFDILMTRKTLIKVLKVEERKEKRSILEKEVIVRSAQVLVLSDDGKQVRSENAVLFLTEDVADSVHENDIVNVVMVSTVKSNSKTGRPIVIGKIGKTVTPSNIKCIVSMVLWKMLQPIEDNSSPTLIGTINQVKSNVIKLIQKNSRMFSSENFSSEMLGWTKDLPKKISQSIEEMFPLFLEDDEKVYQISPVIMSFVATSCPDLLKNRKFILSLVKLFDTMKVNSNFWGSDALMNLRTSSGYESLQSSSSFANKILENSPRLVNRMVYSRILSQHFTHWG